MTATGFYAHRALSIHEKLFELRHALAGPSVVRNARKLPPYVPFDLPRDRGMRFLVIGDWGTGGSGQARVAQSMARTSQEFGCDYVISTGDNIYPKGVASATDEQWNRKFVKMYRERGLTQPFYATLGNHDYGLEPDAQIAYAGIDPQWRMPARFYTAGLDAPDGLSVQLFSLDTQRVQTAVKGAAEEQRAWLDRELSNSKARWKIVFGHHMLYSNGVYGNLKRIRDAFEATLVKHHVPIYLCGHDHDLQLLKPVNGVSYAVSGGGGGHRDTTWGDNSLYAATNMGYLWMALLDGDMYLHFHDADGAIRFAHKLNA